MSKTLPVARVAMTQMNLARMTTGAYRLQHTGPYKGRQPPDTPEVEFPPDKPFKDEPIVRFQNEGRFDERTMGEKVKDKAYEAKETIKEKAGEAKERVQEIKEDLKNRTAGTQSSKYDPKEKGGPQTMESEGNVWDGNEYRAKESTVDRHGIRGTKSTKSTIEKVGDLLKGATQTVSEKVSEGAKKMGLK